MGEPILHMDFSNMSDRELLVLLANDMTEVKERVKTQNGRTGDNETDIARLQAKVGLIIKIGLSILGTGGISAGAFKLFG